jgi:hypothetical protein
VQADCLARVSCRQHHGALAILVFVAEMARFCAGDAASKFNEVSGFGGTRAKGLVLDFVLHKSRHSFCERQRQLKAFSQIR